MNASFGTCRVSVGQRVSKPGTGIEHSSASQVPADVMVRRVYRLFLYCLALVALTTSIPLASNH